MIDDTLHENMIPLTVEDRLLIKTSQTEKITVEFSARQWRWYMLTRSDSQLRPFSLEQLNIT